MQLRLFLTRDQLQEAIGDVDHVLSFVRGKIKLFFKRLAYGSAIGVVSLLAIGGSMYAFGLTPFPEAAQASPAGTVASIFAQLLLVPIYILLGILSAVFGGILDMVIGYPWSADWNPLVSIGTTQGGFANVSAVVTGWRIVRDICNLFFAIILLVIAMAAVLNLESYKWQDLLRKFILYAVLINFSKTICGFFTDAATVAMATFGGSLGTSWGASIIGAFGLPAITGLSEAAGLNTEIVSANDGVLEMLGAVMLMIVFQFLAVAIIAAFVVMIVLRIVMLWFLIVLSPIAYVTRILDITKRYSSQWWEMWGRYLMMGPFIVFFLWLTLTMMNGSAVGASASGIGGAAATPLVQGLTEVEELSKLQSGTATGGSTLSGLQGISSFQATQPNIIANFAIAFVMLFGALRFSSGMAGEVGSYVSSASDSVGNFTKAAMVRNSQFWSNRFGNLQDGKTFWSGNKIDNPSASWQNAGIAGNILANTVFDPFGAMENLKNNLDAAANQRAISSSKGSRDLAQNLTAGDQKNRAVRLLGGLFGAFTEQGRAYVQDLTLGGAYRYAVGFPEQGRKEAAENAKIAEAEAVYEQALGQAGPEQIKEKQARQKTLVDQLKPLTEQQSAIENYQKQNSQIESLTQLAAGLASGDDGLQLDIADPMVKGAIEAHIKNVESLLPQAKTLEDKAAIQNTAEDLKGVLTAGGTTTLGALSGIVGTHLASGPATQLSQAFRASLGRDAKKGLTTETKRRDDLRAAVEKAGVAVNPDGSIDSAVIDSIDANIVTLNAEKTTVDADLEASKKSVQKAKDEVERLRAAAYTKRGVNAAEARALNDQQVEEQAKKVASIEPRETDTEYMRAIDTNVDMVKAIIRKAAQAGELAWIMRNFNQRAIDGNENVRKAFVESALESPDLGFKIYKTDANGIALKDEKGVPNVEATPEDIANGMATVRMNNGATGAHLFRRAVLERLGGESRQAALRYMSGIAGIEGNLGRLSYAGLVNRTPDGQYEENTAEAQRFVGKQFFAAKNPLLLVQADMTRMLVQADTSGDVIGLNAGAADEYIRNEAAVIQNMSKMNAPLRAKLAESSVTELLRAHRDENGKGFSEDFFKALAEYAEGTSKDTAKKVDADAKKRDRTRAAASGGGSSDGDLSEEEERRASGDDSV